MKEYEKHYQVGGIIKIRREPPFAKRFGFLIDTEHVIQKPPENKINSAMGVWILDKREILRQISFPFYIWTGKTKSIKRQRRT
jgi:hypothetical protein